MAGRQKRGYNRKHPLGNTPRRCDPYLPFSQTATGGTPALLFPHPAMAAVSGTQKKTGCGMD
jgi:hypothetical protein